jgi:putative transcriptional regulator
MEVRIKEVLREKGIKQKFLCEKLEINESVLSLIINGKRIPSQSRVKAMAKVLKVSVKDLYPQCKVSRINYYDLEQ